MVSSNGKSIPLSSANILSKLTFWWTVPLFLRGTRASLTPQDLPSVPNSFTSEVVGQRLERNWKKELNTKHPSLWRALLRTFGPDYVGWGILLLVDECVIRTSMPILLKYFIKSFRTGESHHGKYLYGGGLLLVSLLHTFLYHIIPFTVSKLAMFSRVACSWLMYKKITRLKAEEVSKLGGSGHVINLLSNDLSRFDLYFYYLPYIFVGIIQSVILTIILHKEFGTSGFAGVGFILLLMPLQCGMGKLAAVFRLKVAEQTDKRGKLIGKIFSSIKIIKMNCWENVFINLVNEVRKVELKFIRRSALLRAVSMIVYITTSRITAFLTLLTYALSGNDITADKAFFAITFYDIMKQTVVTNLPIGLSGFGEISVSIKRIRRLLLLPEMEANESMENEIPRGPNPDQRRITLDNFSCRWDGSTDEVLSGVTLSIFDGDLVSIQGAVGSGKTTLLHAILREIPIDKGYINVNGTVSFCPQEPWLFEGTLRQNILFGSAYDKERYMQVLSACQLTKDLTDLSEGDQTHLDQNGGCLSGGQRARINLARTLYKDADIYLLDDCFSALDFPVAQAVFKEAIVDFLNGKTRILTTHQKEFAELCHSSLSIKNSHIVVQSLMLTPKHDKGKKQRASTIRNPVLEQFSDKALEHIEEGTVKWKTYYEYFKIGNGFRITLLILVGLILSQGVSTFGDYWLKIWTRAEEARHKPDPDYLAKVLFGNGEGNDGDDYFANNRFHQRASSSSDSSWNGVYKGLTFYLEVYGIDLGLILLTTTIAIVLYVIHAIKSNARLHEAMLSATVKTSINFYLENSFGCVLNKFTRDMGNIDELLPWTIYHTLTTLVSALVAMGMIVLQNYLFAIPVIVLLPTLWGIRVLYMKTARAVKRIENIGRSPIFSHVGSTMDGLICIRSARMERTLVREFERTLDSHSSSWLYHIGVGRALGFWLELVSFTFLMVIVLIFTISKGSTAEAVGLALSIVMSLSGQFQWGLKQSAEMENMMTSVERVLELCHLPSEAYKGKAEAPQGWPKFGNISFHNVSLKYKTGEEVLKRLNFEIPPQSSVGILGRTGAGKSSILAALLRLHEPNGTIIIDEVSTAPLNLEDLRQSFSVISQEPTLFCGTVRFNLDPENKYDDDVLWKAIELAKLDTTIPSLSHPVGMDGNNFSQGQKQLLCLARAIVHKRKILLMDEAAANVDSETERCMQFAVETEFKESTKIIVTHRVQSIRNCDILIILQDGEILEIGRTDLLLQNPSSYCFKLFNNERTDSEI